MFAGLATDGYGGDGSLQLVCTQAYALRANTLNAELATDGYGAVGSSLSSVCTEGYTIASVTNILTAGLATDGYGTANSSLSTITLDGYTTNAVTPPVPPPGKQFMAFSTLPWAVGFDSVALNANPACANGDLWIADLITAPDGFAVVQFPDGTYQVLCNFNAARQSFQNQVFQQSSQTYSNLFLTYTNDKAPRQITPFNSPITLVVGVAMVALNVALYVVNVQGDAMSISVTPGTSLPPGIVFDGVNTVSGAPSTPGVYIFQMRATSLVTGAFTDLGAIQMLVSAQVITGPGFRVTAVYAGTYAGTYHQEGDVFDIAQASDYSDSTVNYQYAAGDYVTGWMLQVPQTTPLLTYGSVQSPPLFPVILPQNRMVM